MAAPAANCNADAAAAAVSAGSTGSKRSFPGDDAADSDRRVQPRHFHSGPDPAADSATESGDGVAAEEPDHPLPAATTRLHRHALESIFAFLNQRELAKALQVSRSWLAAVKSMASLQLAVAQPWVPLRVVPESAMGRHVAELGDDEDYVPMTAESLAMVARLMPQLRVLYCQLELPSAQGPLTFPSGLQQLCLRLDGHPAAADVNATLVAISRLPLLEVFVIHLDDFDERISFAPLASLPLLRELEISQLEYEDEDQGPAVLSDAHVAELRALPHLRELVVDPMPTSLLRHLLAQPHEVQWQQIWLSDLNDEAASLLPQLPSLTSVGSSLDDLDSAVTCSRFDFLRRLPDLTTVRLRITGPSVAGRIESLMAELQCCTKIEELELSSPELTVAHLAELLPRLPRLQKLVLFDSKIASLSFLAQPPMTHQLTHLMLTRCRKLPLTELRHVHSLRALKSLHLEGSFTAPMDAHCQSFYTPPSLIMPQLEEFDYYEHAQSSSS